MVVAEKKWTCIRDESNFQSYSFETGEGSQILVTGRYGNGGKFAMKVRSRVGHCLVRAEYDAEKNGLTISPLREKIRLLTSFTYIEDERGLPERLKAGLGALMDKAKG